MDRTHVEETKRQHRRKSSPVEPPRTKNRGRPKNTRRRGVEQEMKEAGVTWGSLEAAAQDCAKWKQFVGGLCSASSCIVVIARTSTSRISASSATSSAKSRSVNTSFPKVTYVIPRCEVRSIMWSIGSRNKSGTIFLPCRTSLPTANQSDNTPSPQTQLHVSEYRGSMRSTTLLCSPRTYFRALFRRTGRRNKALMWVPGVPGICRT